MPTAVLPHTSVIIVSRHRPDALRRALVAVGQLDHPAVEVVVVADPAACGQIAPGVKVVPFDTPNISAARNAGLAVAGGAVIAFLDDDAVPEPSWLARLTAPFEDQRVVAATGFVRGRNGISWQWQAGEVDATGRDWPLRVPDGTSLHGGSARRAIKTQGTNCAFRADDLRAIGGFDPAYRFYLDEADVNLRLAGSGVAGRGLTAVVTDAVVHHGFAASARRRADRVPLDLTEIGASAMVFLRRHAEGADWAVAVERLRAEQRARLLRLMVEGRIEPRDVARLETSLEAGLSAGASRALTTLPPIAGGEFQPLAGSGPRPGRIVAGRIWQRRALQRQARDAVAQGDVVSLVTFDPTARFHRHVFNPQGFWDYRGGLFGRAARGESLFRWHRFADRLRLVSDDLARFRPVK